MSAPAKDLLRFLSASMVIILALATLNFVVDPLQLFRPARLFAAMYSPDSRMQDAGLIRSQEFDTVFMGTSLAIHFRQSDIDRLLGVKSLKLSMTGSTSHEQSFVIAAALERHPKRVIWQVDDWIFRDALDVDHDIYLPADLYRRNVKGIAGYLFSGAMARESAWILARSIPPLAPLVARLTNGVMFKFPISRVDDINILRPEVDVSEAYNAKKAMAAFRSITRSRAQRLSRRRIQLRRHGEEFRARCGRSDREQPGRQVRHLLSALLDPAMGGDAGRLAFDAEDRLRFHRLCGAAAGAVPERQPA